jgi:hypothetical protein
MKQERRGLRGKGYRQQYQLGRQRREFRREVPRAPQKKRENKIDA